MNKLTNQTGKNKRKVNLRRPAGHDIVEFNLLLVVFYLNKMHFPTYQYNNVYGPIH